MTETTKCDPKIHCRHSVRLLGYDYASTGLNFITICTQDRKRFFGRIQDQKMELNEFGMIARDELLKTPSLRSNVRIDAWVVMPDHVHVIFEIMKDANHGIGPYSFMADDVGMPPVEANDPGMINNAVMAPVGAHSCSPLQPTVCDSCAPLRPTARLFRRPKSVPSCIAQYKATTTRLINEIRDIKGVRIWQRNFNDRIIRDQEELDYYRRYIHDNPKNWKGDKSILQKSFM